MSDGLITARARIAQKMTEVIESDRRVRRCKRIDFVGEGGALQEADEGLPSDLWPPCGASALSAPVLLAHASTMRSLRCSSPPSICTTWGPNLSTSPLVSLVGVELVPDSDAKSRDVIARELEFAVCQAVPALPWARVQVV
jgi:hypothetical protein